MRSELKELAAEHGDRLKVVPVKYLKEIKDILEIFKQQQELNGFQKWIVNNLYQFEIPEEDFKVNSIILVAVHHPFYAKVNFHKEGKQQDFLSLVRSDFSKIEAYLNNYTQRNGYSIKLAKNLPLKRLGVHCGLAKYGRNNITYIKGLGSSFSYIAYFSDMIGEDTWVEGENADICKKCNLCIKSCPTGAIVHDRFLIDNQKCLSYMNEISGEFPPWVPLTAHHTLYDCLMCQRICPMNSGQEDHIIESISFTEEETNLLLDGKPIEFFSEQLKEKIDILGIDEWYSAIPRNLKTLFNLHAF